MDDTLETILNETSINVTELMMEIFTCPDNENYECTVCSMDTHRLHYLTFSGKYNMRCKLLRGLDNFKAGDEFDSIGVKIKRIKFVPTSSTDVVVANSEEELKQCEISLTFYKGMKDHRVAGGFDNLNNVWWCTCMFESLFEFGPCHCC